MPALELTTGTLAMDLLEPGFDWSSLHTITGQIALWLIPYFGGMYLGMTG
jgi:hypothetical protein